LRDEEIYQVLTPDECLEVVATDGPHATLQLHPLCGGLPIDEAWRSLELLAAKVVPNL
jgi:hypothetical protein